MFVQKERGAHRSSVGRYTRRELQADGCAGPAQAQSFTVGWMELARVLWDLHRTDAKLEVP